VAWGMMGPRCQSALSHPGILDVEGLRPKGIGVQRRTLGERFGSLSHRRAGGVSVTEIVLLGYEAEFPWLVEGWGFGNETWFPGVTSLRPIKASLAPQPQHTT
jgi:hypothetical protein